MHHVVETRGEGLGRPGNQVDVPNLRAASGDIDAVLAIPSPTRLDQVIHTAYIGRNRPDLRPGSALAASGSTKLWSWRNGGYIKRWGS